VGVPTRRRGAGEVMGSARRGVCGLCMKLGRGEGDGREEHDCAWVALGQGMGMQPAWGVGC